MKPFEMIFEDKPSSGGTGVVAARSQLYISFRITRSIFKNLTVVGRDQKPIRVKASFARGDILLTFDPPVGGYVRVVLDYEGEPPQLYGPLSQPMPFTPPLEKDQFPQLIGARQTPFNELTPEDFDALFEGFDPLEARWRW